ncbi:ribosylnicotinamide kinase [Entomortierella beljakovae]|nr:ribosylnicotinamide kinase [Entomortierella beljakovae]
MPSHIDPNIDKKLPPSKTKVITIGVSGPSSGGKTTTSRYLRSILPNSTIIHQDDFYLPEDQLPLDEKTGLANWDCPEAIDFPSMISTLIYVKEHGAFPDGFDSKEDKNEIGSGTTSSPIPQQVLDGWRNDIMDRIPVNERLNTKFVIIDGFILYVNEQLRETIDVKFYLTASYQILKDRRESRKGYATLEGYWVDPPGYFDDIVWPNYLAFNSPFVKLTEAVENGTDSGTYDSTKELSERDPMTQRIDIITSSDGCIHGMVRKISNLLAKRIDELH